MSRPPPSAQEILQVLEEHPPVLFELLQSVGVSMPKIAGVWQPGPDGKGYGSYRASLSEILVRVSHEGEGKWCWRYRTEDPLHVSNTWELAQQSADHYLLDRGWTLLYPDGTWVRPERDLEREERRLTEGEVDALLESMIEPLPDACRWCGTTKDLIRAANGSRHCKKCWRERRNA